MSMEELSTVFIKGSSSVQVVLEGGHMSVETNTAGSSLIDPLGPKAFGTPDRLLICCASFFDSLVELIQFHLQCDVLIERIVPVSTILFSFVVELFQVDPVRSVELGLVLPPKASVGPHQKPN